MKTRSAVHYFALFSMLAFLTVGGACASAETTNLNTPLISSLVAEHTHVYPLGNTKITCSAVSPQDLPLNYHWVCTDGAIAGSGPSIIYEAPRTYGDFHIMVTVDDGQGNKASQTLKVTVIVRDPSKCCR
ncbi:MAG: hypothetical protein JW901_12535 [Dehalococcoidia bacterium]|nr:hypothetical protein [Dehalococcoidia bacterium]